MFKRNFILVCFLVALFSLGSTKAAKTLFKSAGSVGSTSLSNYLADPIYQTAESVARSYYSEKTGQNLGSVIGVSSQIVSGVNYYITFSASTGTVQCTVWSQAWIPSYTCTGCA